MLFTGFLIVSYVWDFTIILHIWLELMSNVYQFLNMCDFCSDIKINASIFIQFHFDTIFRLVWENLNFAHIQFFNNGPVLFSVVTSFRHPAKNRTLSRDFWHLCFFHQSTLPIPFSCLRTAPNIVSISPVNSTKTKEIAELSKRISKQTR
jgi:hypothetical protein